MNNEDMKRFLEELEDSGGDLEYWSERKDRENDSFYGFELNPENEKRLNTLKGYCETLTKLDKGILYYEGPLTNKNRHGSVRLSLPTLFFTSNKQVAQLLSKCFAIADYFTIAAPRLIDEDAEDEDFIGDRNGREVVITFNVAEMWKTYGKAPFI